MSMDNLTILEILNDNTNEFSLKNNITTLIYECGNEEDTNNFISKAEEGLNNLLGNSLNISEEKITDDIEEYHKVEISFSSKDLEEETLKNIINVTNSI